MFSFSGCGSFDGLKMTNLTNVYRTSRPAPTSHQAATDRGIGLVIVSQLRKNNSIKKSNQFAKWFVVLNLPEFEADEALRGDDGRQDPALPADLVALWVIQQLEGLPKANSAPKQHEEEPDEVEGVVGLPPENESG